MMIEINRAHGPFPCILALRFVPGTRATLGFTRFPRTCIIDIDGPYSTRTRSYFARIWQALHDSVQTSSRPREGEALRFAPDDPRFDRAVAGIGAYGNSVGVPTVGVPAGVG